MKRRVVIIAAAVVALLLAIFGFVISRQRLRRVRVFQTAPAEQKPLPPSASVREVGEWTDQFRLLEATGRWGDLVKLLDAIAKQHPTEYANWHLGYLHTRALIEDDQPRDALKMNQQFLADGNEFRDLALYHQAEIEDARNEPALASRNRQLLIFGTPSSIYRDQAIEDEIEYLGTLDNAAPLVEFAGKISPSAPTSRRRDLEARIVEMSGAAALQRAVVLLRAGTSDDASDRVSRAIDKPELVRQLARPDLTLLGESMRNHRHFERAVVLLSSALAALPAGPSPERDDLTFAIGRSYYGDEKYAQAQRAYMTGANATRDMKRKAEFLLHAARAAHLQNDDAGADRLLTASISVPGSFPSTAAAYTQRLRNRSKARRFGEAAADLASIQKAWPRDHSVVDAGLAYAVGLFAAGNKGAAVVALNAIPRNLQDKYDTAEIEYWRARALEDSNPSAAFAAYLNVLRATVPSHFAYFARQRLDGKKLTQELQVREAQVAQLTAKNQWDLARRIQTDRILLSTADHANQLNRLKQIYLQIPAYRNILELKAQPFPKFPLAEKANRTDLLMAMGLFDEAADDARKRWPLTPLQSALTQSLALNRGNASRESIYAIEVLMKSVPADFVPDLLPQVVRELLYPRYFFSAILDDAKRFDADPTLVLSIMREESRFNPRAKSEAAARGLLQFIITTARSIGREVGIVDVDPEDLYDPRVIIRLGAKYVSTLMKDFNGDRYKAAAAYNAGPNQVQLWSRIAPGPGEDFFLSSINFSETKHYVRKVMNSYKRYGEIYGGAGPQGGVQIEP